MPHQLGQARNGNTAVTVYTKTSTDAVPASTTFVIKGLIAGKSTFIVIGNTKYTITVTAEDLSGVTPLPISLWFTNCDIEVVNGDTNYTYGQTSGDFVNGNWQDNKRPYYISVPAGEVNSAEGKNISQILPETLFRYENSNTYWEQEQAGKAQRQLVLWSGRIHTKTNNNIQLISGTDHSNIGTEFKYIRYWNKQFEVTATPEKPESWIKVTGEGSTSFADNCKEQLAVYYMMRTEITKEVTTDVADWGHTSTKEYDDAEKKGQYVLLDFAVKYPSGTRNPNDFPVPEKTYSFHCDRTKASTTSSSPVFQQNGYYYRQLNNFRAIETNTDTYELYMVTVTMTSDNPDTRLTVSGTAYDLQSGYEYEGEEQVLWAIDQAALDATEMKPYKAITANDTTYSGCKLGTDGYEPYVRGVEVYEAHGALITYYIRPKVTQGALTVNYYVQGENIPFYSYNINVNTNDPSSIFKEYIQLDDPWKGPLKNGDVLNILKQTEWVSADLTKMPAIGAQYRYSDFTCVKVERATDGKTVNLYYTFKADAAFVIDFGLPLTIPVREINAELANAQITKATAKGNLYGNVEFDVSQQSLIYTPTKPVDKIDIFKVTLEGTRNGASSSVIYTISIIPATNVYYEETFITNPEDSGWTNAGTVASNVKQDLEEAGKKQNVYGYDTKVDKANPTIGYSMGSAYKATLNLTGDYVFSEPLTFTFEGTGIDIISECNDKTGMLFVEVIGANGTEKNGGIYRALVDTYFVGDGDIINKGDTIYQVPVVRNLELPYDKYTVTIKGYLWKKAGVVANAGLYSLYAAKSATGTAVSTLANVLGITEEDIDVIYMDDNSILNPNAEITKVREENSVMAAYTLDAAENTASSATVYVDGFRVYNPLGATKIEEIQVGLDKKNNPVYFNRYASIGADDSTHAYNKDKEANVVYYSAYDLIKNSASAIEGEDTNYDSYGVYIEYDGETESAYIADYKNQGPQNEVYLAPNQAIAFGIKEYRANETVVQISAKLVTDGAAGAVGDESIGTNATEMYYDISGKFVQINGYPCYVISNAGTGVLAISNIKLSANIEPYMDSNLANVIVDSLTPGTQGTFTPASFEVKTPKDNPKQNRNFIINIKASAWIGEQTDVTSVSVKAYDKNNTDNVVILEETLTAANAKSVASKRSNKWNFNKVCKLPKGTYTFEITAKNDEGKFAVYTVDITVVE